MKPLIFPWGHCHCEAPRKQGIWILKMTLDDDLSKAFLNSFECSSQAADWPEDQWMAILLFCQVGPAQQAVDTLAPDKITDYTKVHDAILQTLHLSQEVYQKRLQEVMFGSNFHRR